MYIYKIILEVSYPLEIWDYRSSPVIGLEEAIWLVESFPFEEPEIYQVYPDEGPAPQIMFANFRNNSMMVIEYQGKELYGLTLAHDAGKHFVKSQQDLASVKDFTRIFWEEKNSGKRLKRKLFGRKKWNIRLFPRIWRPGLVNFRPGFTFAQGIEYFMSKHTPNGLTYSYPRPPFRKPIPIPLFSPLSPDRTGSNSLS